MTGPALDGGPAGPVPPDGVVSAGDPAGAASAGDPAGVVSAGDPAGAVSAGDPAGAVSAAPPDGAAPAADPGEPTAGRNDLGAITVSESVVAKLAAQAAMEVPDAGAAAPRLLGRSLSGAGGLGVRSSSLNALPKASAHVDGAVALVRLELSVRWPASVPAVTAAVRHRVRTRLAELTGLEVPEVTIRVTDLVVERAETTTRSRVR